MIHRPLLFIRICLVVTGIMLSCNASDTQRPEKKFTPPSDKTYQVHQVADLWTLEGTDSVWLSAEVLDEFVFPWQDRDPAPTEFRALYNTEYFFFQFLVEDEDVVLWEDPDQNLAVIGSDRVELFFAANDSLDPYYQLEMDPRTWVFDAKSSLYRRVDENWNWEGMQTYADLTDSGYVLEGSIPMASFDSLGLWQNESQTELTCGIFRADFEAITPDSIAHNWVSWIVPDSPTPDFHIPSAMGKLIFTGVN